MLEISTAADLSPDKVASMTITDRATICNYVYAGDFLRKKSNSGKVLDLGCGTGYGTYLMQQATGDIVFEAIDKEEKNIAAANKEFKQHRTTFLCRDLDTDYLPRNQDITLIVALSLLDEVEYPELLLADIYDSLCVDGVLLVSFSSLNINRIRYPGKIPRVSFSYRDFDRLIRKRFSQVQDVSNQKVRDGFYTSNHLYLCAR